MQQQATGPSSPRRRARIAAVWLIPLLILTTGLLARAAAREYLGLRSDQASDGGSLSEVEVVPSCSPHDPLDTLAAEYEDTPQAEYPELESSEFGQACGPGVRCDHLAEPGFDEGSEHRLGEATEPPAEGSGPTVQRPLPYKYKSRPSTAAHVRELNHRIQPGETISAVLEWVGVSPGQADEWVRATSAVYNLNRIYVGQEVSLAVDMQSNTLHRLALEIDPSNIVVAERQDNQVVARRERIQHDRHLRIISGNINSSLYAAAVAEGLPRRIISDVAEILGEELNLSRDLHPGDSFRIAYEELTRDESTPSIAGSVMAVAIRNRGRLLEAFYFEAPDGAQSGYYTREGEAVGLAFLRYPVAFSRISSGFSTGRFHPILKRRVPHYGVDLAATRGTPVKAIADGKVRKAGWCGGSGRLVTIRHGAAYESGYAHLSRIARGITPGKAIKKGEVLGYVGSSGRATGPHLHFSISRHGRYIDPLKAKLPRPRPIPESALAAFRTTVSLMDRAYAQADAGPEDLTRVASAITPAESSSR